MHTARSHVIRRRGAIPFVLALAISMAACGSNSSSTSTAGTTIPAKGTAAPASSTSTSTASTTPGSGPSTTCVSAPASTAMGLPGGGEIVCSSPPSAGGGGVPDTNTTIPGASGGVQPDATHGVAQLTFGGSPCPRSAQMCTANFRMVPVNATLTPLSGAATASGVQTASAPNGNASQALSPGHWQVSATPTIPNTTCTQQEFDITAGEVTGVSVDCFPNG